MKPGNDDFSAHVDLAAPAVFAERSDDAVIADRYVALDELARDEIENAPALQHDIGLGEPLPLLDGARKIGDGVAHGAGLLVTVGPLSTIGPRQSIARRCRTYCPTPSIDGPAPVSRSNTQVRDDAMASSR